MILPQAGEEQASLKVLGIETSCDETGVAIYDAAAGLLAHKVYSQAALHREFGGVVPELASRDHIRKLTPMVRACLGEAGIAAGELGGIAYTRGPGLVGALLVGASAAAGMAYAWNLPLIGIHHMEGHLLAPLLEHPAPEFPFLALLVSGGHTQLVAVDGVGQYKMLGETLDDAAGEAFDKTAKLLGLPYPGGPELAKLAELGQPGRFDFPRPMTRKPGLDFSFSGLKTAVLLAVNDTRERAGELDDATRADIARDFEDAVVETLTLKCRRGLQRGAASRLVVAGGVSANLRLRASLDSMAEDLGAQVFYPRPEFCTDNGAMIAFAGYLRLSAGDADDGMRRPRPRWPLEELRSPEIAMPAA